MILVSGNNQGIIDAALHVIRTSRHQQISRRSLALQGYHDAVWIVIPERGINDIPSLLGCTERHTSHREGIFPNLRTEHGVINHRRILRVAPLSHSLHRNLKGRGLRSRRQILVLEDIVHLTIKEACDILHLKRLGKVWLFKSIVALAFHDRMRETHHIISFSHLYYLITF